MPEQFLMWSAAVILAAVALMSAAVTTFYASGLLYRIVNQWRVKGLTGAEVMYIRRVTARLRDRSKARNKRHGRRWFANREVH